MSFLVINYTKVMAGYLVSHLWPSSRVLPKVGNLGSISEHFWLNKVLHTLYSECMLVIAIVYVPIYNMCVPWFLVNV